MNNLSPESPLGAFAFEQASFLKHLFGLSDDTELANLSIVKLQEEVGEVAEAFLASRQYQQPGKLLGHDASTLNDKLADELCDVVVVVAILAEAIGVDLDESLGRRMGHLIERRSTMLGRLAVAD